MRYIRQKPLAATFFKANGGISTELGAIPRYKFMYFANFIVNDDAINQYPESKLANLGSWQNGVSFKIRGIDKPNIDLTHQELNQYNRKRYAYTKVVYHPFTIKMYDTVDDKPLDLWYDYFTYYFADSRYKGMVNSTDKVFNEGISNPTITPTFGFQPLRENLNFFKKVELYAMYGKRYTQINYLNPKITRIDWQQYDSSDSGPAEMQMTLAYEAIEYFINQPTSSIQDELFGFDIEATHEVPGAPEPTRNITSTRSRGAYGILNQLASSQSGLTLNDLAAGISKTFTIANSTLNMFSQLPIGAFSPSLARTIGQANQQVTNIRTGLNLVTNPSVSTQFLGTGYSYAQQAAGVLGQFGRFNFGN